MEKTICKYCGELIIEPRRSQLYHPECLKKAAAERQRERRRLRKMGLKPPMPCQLKEKSKAPEKEKFVYSPVVVDRSPPGWSLAGKSIAQVTCEARALGLTYGQYSAACMTGTIEMLMRDRGIVDGLRRIKNAWPIDSKKIGGGK